MYRWVSYSRGRSVPSGVVTQPLVESRHFRNARFKIRRSYRGKHAAVVQELLSNGRSRFIL